MSGDFEVFGAPRMRVVSSYETRIDRDGTVHRSSWREGEPKREWTEPLSGSPVLSALPGWIWPLVLRGETGE